MNMFARFDENPAMTLRVIMETKRYGWTDTWTDARTEGQCENSIPTTNKVCGGYNKKREVECFGMSVSLGITWSMASGSIQIQRPR